MDANPHPERPRPEFVSRRAAASVGGGRRRGRHGQELAAIAHLASTTIDAGPATPEDADGG
jgi:hypothetical protein